MAPFSFPTTISARDIQRGYKKVFDTVKKTKKPVVVMANNSPQAAIISLEMLEKYNQLIEDQAFWRMVSKIQAANADTSEAELMRDVSGVVDDVRQSIYEKTFGRP